MAAAPVVLTVLRGGTDLHLAVTASAMIGASVLALAVEDPASVVAAAAPVSQPLRRLLRLGLLAAAVVLAWLAAWAVAVRGDVPIGQVDDLAALVVSTGGMALALALWLGRRHDPTPGLAGGVGAVLLILTSSALAMQYPALPSVIDPRWARWWWIAALSWTLVAWWWRDPAARTPQANPLR
jgi:hypothetical protein